MNVYQEHGYKNRREYLDSLADDFGLDREFVYMVASMLGPSEDFDGLIAALEDAEMWGMGANNGEQRTPI